MLVWSKKKKWNITTYDFIFKSKKDASSSSICFIHLKFSWIYIRNMRKEGNGNYVYLTCNIPILVAGLFLLHSQMRKLSTISEVPKWSICLENKGFAEQILRHQRQRGKNRILATPRRQCYIVYNYSASFIDQSNHHTKRCENRQRHERRQETGENQADALIHDYAN